MPPKEYRLGLMIYTFNMFLLALKKNGTVKKAYKFIFV